jgi:hypothetical protein
MSLPHCALPDLGLINSSRRPGRDVYLAECARNAAMILVSANEEAATRPLATRPIACTVADCATNKKKKAPVPKHRGLFAMRSLAVTYSSVAKATLPSALNVFTSEFGMGSGGSRSLWPPDETGRFFMR